VEGCGENKYAIYMDYIKIKIVEILLNTKQRIDEC
jgi:hypothetical protein